jgi:PEP-CTERM motif-containing protein
MRLLVSLCALAVFSVVSAPALLADTINDFDLNPHSVFLASTTWASNHPDHSSWFLENSYFSVGDSSFTAYRHEDYSLYDFFGDNSKHGLHLGWRDVEYRRHHHSGWTNGLTSDPANAVAVPEPSTLATLLSGMAVLLFVSLRKIISA